MSGAFGITQNSAGVGLQARDLRKIIEGMITSPGIISGGNVVGNSGLTYHIEDTVGVTSRGGTDGYSLFYLQASSTPRVSPGGAQQRIDTVWVKTNDPNYDDDKYGVVLGVTEGTPAQVPVAPKIPIDCTPIVDMLVKPNVTNLATGSTKISSYNYSIPYGSTLGRLAINENTYDGPGSSTVNDIYKEMQTKFYVPTDRLIRVTYDGTVSDEGAGANDWIGWVSSFGLDGKIVDNSSRESRIGPYIWAYVHNEKTMVVKKGEHTVHIEHGLSVKVGSGTPYFHYGMSAQKRSYPGRTLTVWDEGVA